MTTFQYNVSRAPRNGCRINFVSRVLEPESLSQRVQDAVARADWDRVGPMGLPYPKSDRNATLLGILTYCYALGVYPTRDIIQKLVKGKGGPALALMGLNAPTLRRFRRAFRPLLAQCLAIVLQTAAQNSGHWTAFTPAMGCDTFAAEAERRIDVAIDWDDDDLDRVRA